MQARHLSDVPAADWERLASRRIYFGHQSVGRNILDGVSGLVRAHPAIGLRVVSLAGADVPAGRGLFESEIGKNGNPAGKTDQFAELAASGLATPGSVMIHKYCYGDFWDPDGPPVEETFAHYRDTMARLRREHPDVTFVHVTVPLARVSLSWKTRVRKLLGGDIAEYRADIRNDRFNDLMRAEYGGREPLFDLARIESTRPDGERESFTYHGKTYETLVPGYTYDDGHLNETGRQRVAEQLLVFLAGLPAR